MVPSFGTIWETWQQTMVFPVPGGTGGGFLKTVRMHSDVAGQQRAGVRILLFLELQLRPDCRPAGAPDSVRVQGA